MNLALMKKPGEVKGRVASNRLKLLLCLLIIFICPISTALAEIRTFEKEVEEIVGRNQSQEQVEAFALQKAKRLAVEEAGTYISSLTVVKNYQLERDEITALASGVVKTIIVGVPAVSIKKGVVHVRVKARIQVDTSVLDQQIEQIMKEKGTLKKLEEERRKVKHLEDRLTSLKSTELKRLGDINRQAFALEREREKQRLFREEQRLKAQKDIAKADLEILRQEQERSAHFGRLQKEQEAARKKELEEIAKEQDRIRRAQLENKRYWKELARKAELSQANWISIDDRLSLKQALEEAKDLIAEIGDISERLDFQFDLSKKNLEKAYEQQIAVTRPILPPDPAPKDAFETTVEYNQRLETHERKVQKAQKENRQRIKELKLERQLKVSRLRVGAIEKRIEILKQFMQRLKDLQSRRFVVPDKKVVVTLGEPDADNCRFPVYLEHKGKKWTKYWKYKDRAQARAFWKTRSHIVAQAMVQIERYGKSVAYRFTSAKVSHLGTKENRVFELTKIKEFEEISRWNRAQTERLPIARRDRDKMAEKLKRVRIEEIVISDGRFIAYEDGIVEDTQTGLMWASKDNGKDIKWADAKAYCENYRGGGYTDWRMPTQDELAGIYDKNKENRHGSHVTKLIDISSCCPWASETRGSGAAYFSFFYGSRGWDLQSDSGSGRALPVRSGK